MFRSFFIREKGVSAAKIGLAASAAAYLVKPDIDMIAPTILELVTASKSSSRVRGMSANL
jgi:hypothetical protein